VVPSTQIRSSHSATATRPAVILATSQADIYSPSGATHRIRLLIDPGSEVTLIAEQLVNKLHLQRRSSTIPILGVGSVSPGRTTGIVSCQLKSTHSEAQVHVDAHVLPQLTAQIPSVAVPKQQWKHLKNLDLADPDFNHPGPIDLLIGADSCAAVISSPGVLIGGPSEPVGLHTVFGCVLFGKVSSPSQQSSHQSLHVISNDNLQECLSKFWIQEEVPTSSQENLTQAEAACEDHFIRTHSRDSSGRYNVRLPLIGDISTLGNSKEKAQRCLRRLLTQLSRNKNLHQRYSDFMSEYESLGHMVSVSSDAPEPPHAYYLPHHGVIREDSKTTKLRVVFNGSSKSSTGVSLNDISHTGQKLQSDVFDVLLWLRHHKCVFTTDISKMFRQIVVHPDDRPLQRIIWHNHQGQEQVFELTTVTYGTRSAPFLSGRVLQQLATDEGEKFPQAAELLKKGTYVDDIGGGADSLEELNAIAEELTAMCKTACLPLAKWKSNHPDFIMTSSEPSSEQSHSFEDLTTKILGISWQCKPDTFTFKGNLNTHNTCTKRAMLSEIAQLFDPLGLISPVVIQAKILMQQLWLEKVNWDDTLTPEIINKWQELRQDLQRLSQLQIPRWLKLHSEISSAQIHGFSDASQLAMAAVVYIRVTNQDSSSIVTLVCSKTKVAPLKRLTIPRLELSAAALLAKLVKRVQVTLELQKVPVFTWTDSSATLAWIKSNPMRWKEFVGNRVSLIQETLPEAHWKFISGKQNPADCASRGLSASQLIHHPLWWTGPAWLSQPPEFWPSKIPPENLHDDLEQRPGLSYAAVIPESPAIWDLIELKEIKTFNKTLTKLLRLTALVQRACSCFKRIPNSKLSVSPINPADLENAKLFWIKTTQQAYYSSEFKILQAGKRLKESHALSRLTAIIDHAGILRVGGRLQNSQLDADSKHPAILPKESQLAQLIISHAHSRTMHGGTQLTLSLIRKSCWIVGGRAPVKSFIQKCLTCARIRGVRAQQLMGQLPASRVTPSLVFENTGVDYAGPVSLKFNQGRGTRFYKGWIAVFVCFSTSAIHLEVATDYSSEAFIKAYRRFISRRGICKTLRSDCGTNFKGADALLKKLFDQSTHQFKELQRLLTNDGTRWIFNPPGAPHMGGKWEAAVKSVKHHLRRTIAETVLTYEDFSTLLAQVEAILNSRPLSALSDDPEDISALTPGHFIRGAALTTIPEPTLTHLPDSRLSHLQRIQARLQTFWDRWSTECLQAHQLTSKWKHSHNDIKQGSLVLLTDERYPPSKWPLARVTQIHPGVDGLTRVVTIKTATATLTRPVTKLALLPILTHEENSDNSLENHHHQEELDVS
jgi:hypothetical protein